MTKKSLAKNILTLAAVLTLTAAGAAQAQEPGVGAGGMAYPNSLPTGQVRTSGAPSTTGPKITDTTGTPAPTKRFTRRPRATHAKATTPAS